jgi:hypothetical protein
LRDDGHGNMGGNNDKSSYDEIAAHE